jgi:anti-sigma regulatory factor (Ser/Thr protein kinase)
VRAPPATSDHRVARTRQPRRSCRGWRASRSTPMGEELIISAEHPQQRCVLARSAPLTLGAISSTPRTARMSARAQLCQWGRPDLADDTEAIVTELVTNAVQASETAGTPVALRLVLTAVSVVVEVLDRAPGVPDPRPPGGAEAENGRGLLMVAFLSRDWGWTRTQAGKIVWAEVPAS